MQPHKILNIAKPLNALQDMLSRELGISKILAQLLINRGIKTKDGAYRFLYAKPTYLLDPYDFSDMQQAVKIVKTAAENKEGVLVFGDYDVDGITSTALLMNTLLKLGVKATHYLPHRVKEGYGLNKNILQIAKQRNIRLLITADCGTNSRHQVEELRRNNIDVIITDHHEPDETGQINANIIINPKIKGSTYKYRDLAGVGVAYKFCQALTGDLLLEDLDLVSLGTISDVVPLTGENRIIAREGLKQLTSTRRIGLKALMETSGIEDREITATFVSYILGPRLNASGRIDTPEIALQLLMSRENLQARELAKTIEAHNRQRQKIEGQILEEAQALIDKEINFKEHKIIVIAKENWHHGVLGIVASKLADRFYRPAIVISLSEEFCKGSGRSIKNFHLFEALCQCKDSLEEFGGHSHAAGLLITRDNVTGFKEKINRWAKEKLSWEDLIPSLDIDMELRLSDLNEEIIKELEGLEPFGEANPEPLFYTRNLKLKGGMQVLGKNTLKFWVTDGTVTYQAIGFGMANFKSSLISADNFDLIYTPRMDNWQERQGVILELKDIFLNSDESSPCTQGLDEPG